MTLWGCGDKRKTVNCMREPASKRTKLSYVRGPCCMRGNRQVRGQAFICGGVLVARWLFLHILQQAAPVTAMNSYPNCCHQLKHRQPLPGQHITSSPLPRHCRSHGPTVSPSSRAGFKRCTRRTRSRPRLARVIRVTVLRAPKCLLYSRSTSTASWTMPCRCAHAHGMHVVNAYGRRVHQEPPA